MASLSGLADYLYKPYLQPLHLGESTILSVQHTSSRVTVDGAERDDTTKGEAQAVS